MPSKPSTELNLNAPLFPAVLFDDREKVNPVLVALACRPCDVENTLAGRLDDDPRSDASPDGLGPLIPNQPELKFAFCGGFLNDSRWPLVSEPRLHLSSERFDCEP